MSNSNMENYFNDLLKISKEQGFSIAFEKYLNQPEIESTTDNTISYSSPFQYKKNEENEKYDFKILSDKQFSQLIKESKENTQSKEDKESTQILCQKTDNDDNRYSSALLSEYSYGNKKKIIEGVNESSGLPVECYSDRIFENWGKTVNKEHSHIFIPKTKKGIKNIVKWANKNKIKVRAAGYRHTWSDLYCDHNQAIISLLPIEYSENIKLPHPQYDPDNNELHSIEIVKIIEEDGQEKALCRIGAGVTNEHFRQWCLKDGVKTGKWTLPLNVIMVEICIGASNAPICHGAGWDKKTLSDLVHEIEFVNAKGELQTVNSPELLKSAAGAFGLLGITTAITLKLDKMSYASFKPAKIDTCFAVPPINTHIVPKELLSKELNDESLKKATKDFINTAEKSYYAEWFWFPFQNQCWVNTWNNDGKAEDAINYPSKDIIKRQEISAYLFEILFNHRLMDWLPFKKQRVKALTNIAMSSLPTKPETIPLIEALHFRRGINNLRVYDMEFEIPIPACKNDVTKPDWSICQRAWWDCINLVYNVYEITGTIPMDLTLEMRVMGSSNITMAPQFGNTLGTCSIEILTTKTTKLEEWSHFMQLLINKWSEYTDSDGNKLNIRPHWAKQWEGLKIDGMEIEKHFSEVSYKTQLPIFINDLSKIAEEGGYKIEDMFETFDNKLISTIFPFNRETVELTSSIKE